METRTAHKHLDLTWTCNTGPMDLEPMPTPPRPKLLDNQFFGVGLEDLDPEVLERRSTLTAMTAGFVTMTVVGCAIMFPLVLTVNAMFR